MEAAAVAARGVSVASSQSRKEWRVVSDHPVQNPAIEDLDRPKLGQGDERLIYEHGSATVDADFFNGGSDNELRLDDVVKQREQLQHLEVNLKARLIARSQVMEIQERFDSQIKEHITRNVKLQEQLHEREKTIQELRRMVEEKDKELHAIRLDHEAAWAKEDLLREQNKELATFRRERDNSEAERAQHIKTIHDLREHIQEKDRQFMEMQEQHRVAQETIIYKDEQMREAQAWISRVQEMDALQSTTNHSLQAELRERTDQYTQLWLSCQRQFAEMERVHLHTVQQLQLELSEARERSGSYTDESCTTQTNVQKTSQFENINSSQLDARGADTLSDISGGLQNGNAEVVSSIATTVSARTQTDHIPDVQMGQSVHGMPAYLPPGQLTALHPFVMHQQGVSQNLNAHMIQSHAGQFHSIPAYSSLPHWENHQASSDGQLMPNHEQNPSKIGQNLIRQETNQDHEVSVTGQEIHSDYLDGHISQGLKSHSLASSPNEEGQVPESIDHSYIVSPQSQQSLRQISSQLHVSLRLKDSNHDNEHQEKSSNSLFNHRGEAQSLTTEKVSSAANASEAMHPIKLSETTLNKVAATVAPEIGRRSSGSVGKTADKTLINEESLLACIVRTTPPGPSGRVEISSTLLPRLSKMLAPLDWSDYYAKYGNLVDFLGSHPELFVIEGDHIQVREGAQKIIAAMAARAKVHATAIAAAATSSHSSLLPSVAVTPMAQSRSKKAAFVNSNSVKAEKSVFHELQHSAVQNQQHPNGISSNAFGSFSSVRILNKHNDRMELNGPEVKPSPAYTHLPNGNGTYLDKADLGTSQSKVIHRGRPSPNFSGKQPGRSTGALPSSRR